MSATVLANSHAAVLRKLAIASCVCAVLWLPGVAAASDTGTLAAGKMPKALQGIWYEDSEEGRQQCAACRKDAGDETVLVGKLWIRRHDFDQFDEYGEGYLSRVASVEALPGKRWRVRTLTLIEGDDIGQPGETVFELEQERLRLFYEEEGDYLPPVMEGGYSKCR